MRDSFPLSLATRAQPVIYPPYFSPLVVKETMAHHPLDQNPIPMEQQTTPSFLPDPNPLSCQHVNLSTSIQLAKINLWLCKDLLPLVVLMPPPLVLLLSHPPLSSVTMLKGKIHARLVQSPDLIHKPHQSYVISLLTGSTGPLEGLHCPLPIPLDPKILQSLYTLRLEQPL